MTTFHLLPSNLGTLANLTAAPNGTRPSMAGVQVRIDTDGNYRVAATDSRLLGMVTGRCESGDCYPTLAALDTAPNGATEALVPAKEWAAAMKAAKKIKARHKPILKSVAVVLNENVTTLASTDLDSTTVSQPRNLDGRFPNIDLVLPKEDNPPAATISVDAEKLIELLKAALEVAPEDRGHPVTIEIRTAETPLVVRTKNDSQAFMGLLMPLTTEGKR